AEPVAPNVLRLDGRIAVHRNAADFTRQHTEANVFSVFGRSADRWQEPEPESILKFVKELQSPLPNFRSYSIRHAEILLFVLTSEVGLRHLLQGVRGQQDHSGSNSAHFNQSLFAGQFEHGPDCPGL